MTNEVLQKIASDEQNISSSNGLEPSLRFGHFVGNWEKSKLSSLFKKCLLAHMELRWIYVDYIQNHFPE